MKDNNGIKTWKYIPQQNSEDAYEKIIADIQDISKDYLTSSAEEQEKIIETILLKIREITFLDGMSSIKLPVPANACETAGCKPQDTVIFNSSKSISSIM